MGSTLFIQVHCVFNFIYKQNDISKCVTDGNGTTMKSNYHQQRLNNYTNVSRAQFTQKHA